MPLSARLFPGLGDRLAARRAYESQMTDDDAPKERPDNLFDTVDGACGAHGRFDARAKSRSLQMTAAAHLGELAIFVVLVGLLLAWLAAD